MENAANYSLWQMVSYFLRLGTIGFGGPVALVGYMQRDLVEQRGWISEADYKEGLALGKGRGERVVEGGRDRICDATRAAGEHRRSHACRQAGRSVRPAWSRAADQAVVSERQRDVL